MKIILFYSSFIFFLYGCAGPAKHNLKKLTKERDCRHVVIAHGQAIAACGNLLIVQDLKNNIKKEYSTIDSSIVEADNIAVAGDFLFTIGLTDHMKMYDILTPLIPVLIDSRTDVPVQLFKESTLIMV